MSLLTRLGNYETVVEKEERKERNPRKTNYRQNNKEIELNLHNFLVEELKRPSTQEGNIEETIEILSEEFFEKEGDKLTYEEKKEIIHNISNELLGYGPISPFLADPHVTEIMVNGPNDIYIEINGRIEKTNQFFRDDLHVLRVIEKIVSPIGRRIDESVPMVDARLPDGSRVNAIIPPLALNGPTITIRKFSEKPFTIYDLLRMETLNEAMADFLKAAVESKLNIFISGGTGSGKTSTLNVLSSFIPKGERIVTIEDAAELQLSQDHIVSLEARPSNLEGKGEITIRDLVRNSLRMRPDRIIVGEVRSAEALDMLQAMNTGHDGGLGTGHANSPRDLVARLETMVFMAGFELPVKAIREQIAGAIDLIVHQTRMKDGSRKITHISEVLGLEGDTIVIQDIFLYKEIGVISGRITGDFISTGIRPACSEKLELNGYKTQNLLRGEW